LLIRGEFIEFECVRRCKQVRIDVVEIDEAIVSVATDWFNFVTDDLLTVTVADGLEYIQQLDRNGDCFILAVSIIHFVLVVDGMYNPIPHRHNADLLS